MSEYVMVPVPEEFAEEVTRYVQWTVTAADRPELDDELMAIGIQSLDEPHRAVLAFVVDAVLNGRLATVPELALILGVNEREVMGTMLETNQRMRVAEAPVTMLPQKAPGAETFDLKDQIIFVTPAAAESVAKALNLDSGAGETTADA
jgi:hypothetical protein